MTTRTAETSPLIYARVAGFTFLAYIVAGIAGMALADGSPVNEVLSLLLPFAALVLGVTLYALTRALGPALAMLALTCRRSRGGRGRNLRHLFRRGQPALLLAAPPRPDDPRPPGLARRAGVGPARCGPSGAGGGTARRPGFVVELGHLARVAAHAGVRGSARLVADDQRRRHAHIPLRLTPPRRWGLTEYSGPWT